MSLETSPIDSSQVDWAVVAEKAGYNNAKVAQTRYDQIRKKFQEFVSESLSKAKKESPSKPSKDTLKKQAENKDESPKTRVKPEPRIKHEEFWEEKDVVEVREDDSTEATVKPEPRTKQEADSEDEDLYVDFVEPDEDHDDDEWV
jgi:Na+-transporting NADH:ubiquinone oxidoreductase subunit NqrC